MVDAEISILGTNDAKIGGDLSQQWEFPESAGRDCIYNHHIP